MDFLGSSPGLTSLRHLGAFERELSRRATEQLTTRTPRGVATRASSSLSDLCISYFLYISARSAINAVNFSEFISGSDFRLI